MNLRFFSVRQFFDVKIVADFPLRIFSPRNFGYWRNLQKDFTWRADICIHFARAGFVASWPSVLSPSTDRGEFVSGRNCPVSSLLCLWDITKCMCRDSWRVKWMNSRGFKPRYAITGGSCSSPSFSVKLTEFQPGYFPLFVGYVPSSTSIVEEVF
jgi:hypothetical protein